MTRKHGTMSFRLLAVALLVLLLSAYTLADNRNSGTELGQITGTVTYRERMALPPESSVTVTLVEIDEDGYVIVAEEIIWPKGQVPIPFVLEYERDVIDPERDYAVRATITDKDGEVMWSLAEPLPIKDFDDAKDMELWLTNEAPEESPERSLNLLPGHVFQDGDTKFTAYFGDDTVYLVLPDNRMVILPQVRAASGAKYTDGLTVFWNKGDQAFIELEGTSYQTYLIEDNLSPWEKAKRSGVDFRAIGQEPGWVLEIRGNETLTFIGDYGEVKLITPLSQAETDPHTGDRVYFGETGVLDIEVVIEESPYTDTMDGEEFPTTVTVHVGEHAYQGGGRYLN